MACIGKMMMKIELEPSIVRSHQTSHDLTLQRYAHSKVLMLGSRFDWHYSHWLFILSNNMWHKVFYYAHWTCDLMAQKAPHLLSKIP